MRGQLPGSEKEIDAATEDLFNAEADVLYVREYHCPVCEAVAPTRLIRSGKNRVTGRDMDLRQRYEPADAEKYTVVVCPQCGHTAFLSRFESITEREIKALRQWMKPDQGLEEEPVYSYETAYARIRCAMKDAMVRGAKPSETGYIALHTAWLIRGWREMLEKDAAEGKSVPDKQVQQLRDMEKHCLSMATDRLSRAMETESFPIAGMDEMTFHYLLAALNCQCGSKETAAQLVMPLLRNRQTPPALRILAEDLRDELRPRR